MLSWLGKKMIARNMRAASAGDIAPLLKMDAEDVKFRFPGDSSWATELQGKDRLEQWLQRFADVGIQISPDEVVLKGFPWKQTICVRGTDLPRQPRGRAGLREPLRDLGPHLLGPAARLRGLRGHAESSKLDEYLASVGKL